MRQNSGRRKRSVRQFLVIILLIGTLQTDSNSLVLIGSGNIVQEIRPVSDFKRIRVCCGIQVTLQQGDVESVAVAADDNILLKVHTVVKDGTLTIGYQEGTWGKQFQPSKPVKVHVNAKDIRRLYIADGGQLETVDIETKRLGVYLSSGGMAKANSLATRYLDLEVTDGGRFEGGKINTDQLEFTISGGAATIIKLNAKLVELRIKDQGNGRIAGGKAHEQIVALQDGSNYFAPRFKSEIAKVKGEGNATVWVTKKLKVDLKNGSVVEYHGKPRVAQTLSEDSQVMALGEHN